MIAPHLATRATSRRADWGERPSTPTFSSSVQGVRAKLRHVHMYVWYDMPFERDRWDPLIYTRTDARSNQPLPRFTLGSP